MHMNMYYQKTMYYQIAFLVIHVQVHVGVGFSPLVRIIEPLTSRCSKFRFKPLATDVLMDRLHYIADKESISCSEEVNLFTFHVEFVN